MPPCLFVSDLHGRTEQYYTLLSLIARERPAGVFLGGDLLPSGRHTTWQGSVADFIDRYLVPEFSKLKDSFADDYPAMFLILGNGDPREYEARIRLAEAHGLWHYIHGRCQQFGPFTVYGYNYVPPTPLMLKDWERYDISRMTDPGCVSPEAGKRTVDVPLSEIRSGTIALDLEDLVGDGDLSSAIVLAHTPPYRTSLDRADLGGDVADLIPVEVHVGSIALSRFVRSRQPLLTLHGHVHESARVTGSWMDRIGKTVCLSAAHDGPELAVVRFDPDAPPKATRELL